VKWSLGGLVQPLRGSAVSEDTYTARCLTMVSLYCVPVLTEPPLEGGAEHSEAGGVALRQPGGARRRAALLQHRVLRLPGDRLHAHIQQLLQGAAREDPGLPLRHLGGQCAPPTPVCAPPTLVTAAPANSCVFISVDADHRAQIR